MKKQKKLYICSIVLAALYALEFLGTGLLIFGAMYNTSPALPVLLTLVALLPLLFSSLNASVFNKNGLSAALICITVIMAVAHLLFTAYMLSKLTFLLITGIPVIAVLAIIALFIFFVFVFPHLRKAGKAISAVITGIILLVVSVFGILKITVFNFTSGGVVFAVEDTYQIAWSTSVKSVGSVTVGNKIYYDETNGQNRVSTLHKVIVPMAVLDEAKSYTISALPVYSESAYMALSGNEITKLNTFRPVDMSDGLQIYNISDNHETLSGASLAGSYFGDKLDVLILNGDIINDVSSLWQISLIYKLANNITGGERPVIFTRGNHECNGTYADELHEYVGSSEGKLYYNVKLGDAWFMVLDTGNDMTDNNWLIRPAANFAQLRADEALWLSRQGDFGTDSQYKFLLAHMAFALSGYSRFPEWTRQLISGTNGKFDLCISGHSHITDYSEAGVGTVTDYPVIRGSVKNNNNKMGDGIAPSAFTGTAIECKGDKITAMFTNAKGEVLQTIAIK